MSMAVVAVMMLSVRPANGFFGSRFNYLVLGRIFSLKFTDKGMENRA